MSLCCLHCSNVSVSKVGGVKSRVVSASSEFGKVTGSEGEIERRRVLDLMSSSH